MYIHIIHVHLSLLVVLTSCGPDLNWECLYVYPLEKSGHICLKIIKCNRLYLEKIIGALDYQNVSAVRINDLLDIVWLYEYNKIIECN